MMKRELWSNRRVATDLVHELEGLRRNESDFLSLNKTESLTTVLMSNHGPPQT